MSLLKPIFSSSILISGTARNVGHCLESEVSRLKESTTEFKSVYFFIVESDSRDNTLPCLENLKRTIPNFEFISLGQLSHQIPSRTDRLAHCRNLIVQQIKVCKIYQGIDFVMVADLDGVNTLLSIEKINACWQTPENWDVICANQLNYYYDIFALRHPFWNPFDCSKQYQKLCIFTTPYFADQLAIRSKQIKIPINIGLIEVESAFGGFAIYKKIAFIEGVYLGNHNGEEICEHVSFHSCLKKQGFKIYINSALINCTEPRIDKNLKMSNRWGLKMVRYFFSTILGRERFLKYLHYLQKY